VRWNFSVVLICISFMVRDGEHFFMCFFAIWISFFEKVLFSSVEHCLIVSLFLEEFDFLSFVYILVISPLSDVFSSHFHILSHSTVQPYCSLNMRDSFTPKMALTGVSHWEVIKLPFCILGQAWISTHILTSLMSGAALPRWFLHLTGFHCASEFLTLTLLEGESPSRSSCSLAPGGISWCSRMMYPSDKGGGNSPSPQSCIMSP
jgi:hypothetical protein